MEVGRSLLISLKGRTRRRLGFYACEDRGATAVEYGLMVTLIAVVVIGGVVAFGASVKGLFEFITANPPFG